MAMVIAVVWALSISPGSAVEGNGAIHGTETFSNPKIIMGNGQCRTTDGTDFAGSGLVTLKDAVQGFTGQADMTFKLGKVFEGPTQNFDSCETQRPVIDRVLTATLSGNGPNGSVSCQWDPSVNAVSERGSGGTTITLPAGGSSTPTPGQQGTCTVTSAAGSATTTNTRLEAVAQSTVCPGGQNGPESCLLDVLFQKVATEGPPPAISGLVANTGPEAGGTAVTISGGDFYQADSVSFGDKVVKTRCSGAGTGAAPCFTLDSNSQITAYSPSGQGAVGVSVLTPVGKSAVGAAQTFTYKSPVVDPPATAPAGGGSPPVQGGPGAGPGINNPGTTAGIKTQPLLPKAQPLGGNGSSAQSNSAPVEPAPPPPPTPPSTPAPPAPPSGGGTAPSFITVPTPTTVPVGVAVGADSPDPTLAPQDVFMVGLSNNPAGPVFLAGAMLLMGCLMRSRKTDWSAGSPEKSPVAAPAIARI